MVSRVILRVSTVRANIPNQVLANILCSLFVARTPSEEARSSGRRSNVENAPCRRPVTGEPATPTSHIWRTILRMPPLPASRRPAAHADPTQPAVRTMLAYCGMDGSLYLGFALCCHSNATHAPSANLPNSAQLGGSLYHAPKLHPGPCSSVCVRPRTDRQTHKRS